MEEEKKPMHFVTAALVCSALTIISGGAGVFLSGIGTVGAIGFFMALGSVWAFFLLPIVIGSSNVPLTYLLNFLVVVGISVVFL